MVHQKEKESIQCGEDKCRTKNCIKCPRKLAFTSTKLTLAEATSIEDFAVVDLDQWGKERMEQRSLQQDVLRKMMGRIVWEKKGRLRRKIVWKIKKIFQFQ
jgi:hypothetical protein